MLASLRLPGWIALAALGAACTTTMRPAPLTARAPVAFVAYLCADACRVDFPATDPLPYHAGAPITQLADGSFEVRYQRRPDGRWAPRAAGRLVAALRSVDSPSQDLAYAATNGLIGWRDVEAELVVQVRATAQGATVRSTAYGFDAGPVLRHLRAAVDFADQLLDGATVGTTLRGCCSHHAPWRAVALLRNVDEPPAIASLQEQRDLLRAALAVAPELTGLDLRIGLIDRALGHDEVAARRLRAASRRTADPAARSLAAQGADDSERRLAGRDGGSLRQSAQTQLDLGNRDSALALAHAASALDPDPVADLRLRHRLQRAANDRPGSLGTALLLREYGADPALDRLLAEDFAQVGSWQLARRAAARLLLGRLPTTEVFTALQSARDELAQSTWLGWAEAVGAPATPPR